VEAHLAAPASGSVNGKLQGLGGAAGFFNHLPGYFTLYVVAVAGPEYFVSLGDSLPPKLVWQGKHGNKNEKE
jgi:hypothetical protein